jgi:enoyl-CoA hydratase
VAVLWGDHGTFCSGADLKAVASGDRNKMNKIDASEDADGMTVYWRPCCSNP